MRDSIIDVPKGWIEIKLKELGLTKAQSIAPSDNPNELFELWSVPSYPTEKPEYQLGKDIGSNKIRVEPEDVLLCKINPRINRVWKVGGKNDHTQIASTEWIVFRSKSVNSDFLKYRLMEPSVRKEICANVSGVGGSLTRARPQIVKELKVTVAPLNEQKRIADKIEVLQAKSKKAKQALDAAKPLLDKLRQSILASAFRGDLTAEWRKKNPDVEPASVLLDRIRAERREKWEENELAKMKAKGKEPKNDNWKSKYKEPESVNINELPELPDGWSWTNINMLSTKVTDGVHKKPNYVETGIPFVTIKNLTAGPGISFDNLNYISESDHKEYIKRAHPERGDILVSKDGTLGVIRLIDTNRIFSIFVSVALIKPTNSDISEYLSYILQTPQCQMSMKATGSGLKHIHLKDLKIVPVPIPPIEEQKKIVTCLKRKINSTQIFYNILKDSSKKIFELNQSILSKAFSGELVPQDPSDEPAAELLARINGQKPA